MNTLTKFWLIAAIAAPIALWGTAPPQAQDANLDRVTVMWSDPTRPGLVKINLWGGGINVKTHESGDVIIETRSTERRRPAPAESAGLRRIGGSTGGLIVEEENNVISVSKGFAMPPPPPPPPVPFAGSVPPPPPPPHVGVNLDSIDNFFSAEVTVQVPVRTNLSLKTLNGGNIVVDGVEGEIEVTNLNGGVTLNNVAGSVVAHSMNGKVSAVLRQVTENKPMAFTSMNGNIDVTLPSSVKANLKMRTDNGEVYSDFEIARRSSNSLPAIGGQRNRNGRQRFEVGTNMFGTINSGGPDFDLRTFNGNIYIRKATK